MQVQSVKFCLGSEASSAIKPQLGYSRQELEPELRQDGFESERIM